MSGEASRRQKNYAHVLKKQVLELARERDLTEIVTRVEEIEPEQLQWISDASAVIDSLKTIADTLQGKAPSPPSPDDWGKAQRDADRAERHLERERTLNEIKEWNEHQRQLFRAQFGDVDERPPPYVNDETAPIIWKAAPNRKHMFGWHAETMYGWRWSCSLPHPHGQSIGGGSTTHGWRGTRDGLERHMKKYHA